MTFFRPAALAAIRRFWVPTTLVDVHTSMLSREAAERLIAARWKTASQSAQARRQVSGSRISPSSNSAPDGTHSRRPRLRSSSTRTRLPCARRASVRWLPMNPAPPVTSSGCWGTALSPPAVVPGGRANASRIRLHAVPEHGPQGDDAVPGADLLAFRDGAGAISYRGLTEPESPAIELHGDLVIQLEAAGLELQLLERPRGVELQPRIHVGDLMAHQDGRPGPTHERGRPGCDALLRVLAREQPAAELANPAREPIAVDDLLPRSQDREQGRIVGGVILEVRILEQNVVSGGRVDAAPQGRAPALVGMLVDEPHPGASADDPFGSVSRSVVDHDDLFGEPRGLDVHALDRLDQRPDACFLVVGRHHDRQNLRHRSLIPRCVPPPARRFPRTREAPSLA